MLLGIVPDNSFLDRYKNSSGLLVRNPFGIVPVSPEFSTRMRTMFVAVSPNLVGNGPLMVGLSTISRTSRYLSDQISIGIEPRSPLSDPIRMRKTCEQILLYIQIRVCNLTDNDRRDKTVAVTRDELPTANIPVKPLAATTVYVPAEA